MEMLNLCRTKSSFPLSEKINTTTGMNPSHLKQTLFAFSLPPHGHTLFSSSIKKNWEGLGLFVAQFQLIVFSISQKPGIEEGKDDVLNTRDH